MKLNLSSIKNRCELEAAGIEIPDFDVAKVREKTHRAPVWLHFGAGNIFRAFPAAVLQKLLDNGKFDRGVIVAEGFDYEIIDRAYRPFDNLSLLAVLKSDGSVDKRIIASITESLKAGHEFEDDWKRLSEIICSPTLQMISFTITEKGYGVTSDDLERGLSPLLMMGKTALLLLERYNAGGYPITLQSMDNCSYNGDKLKNGILTYADTWVKAGLASKGFADWLRDSSQVSFPLSMIDKITPRPDSKVQQMLIESGFEDGEIIVTSKNTYTSAFVNAEETEYLVIEDMYSNGRPPLELGGVLFTNRETVEKVERMKVCTCLNPLHTAMSIYGCLLGFTRISDEMRDEDIRTFITKMGYEEAMPVVTDPGILRPGDFIDAVLTKRLPNPFIPDTPQRIATDTSQKIPIRFGETIKEYISRGLNTEALIMTSLALAGYARYLRGIDDNGDPFTPSPDPLLAELQKIVEPLSLCDNQDMSCLKKLYSRKDIFAVDLYEQGLGDRIEKMAAELFAAPGAVRKTLHKYISQ